MRVVILGGGYAGVVCANRLSRQARGRAEITLVNASARFVERIRLHERAAGRGRPDPGLARLLRRDVALEVGVVTAVDPERRRVEVNGRALAFDRLVLALGSRTDVDSVEGVRQHARTLDPAGAERLAEELRLPAERGGRVVVVGGGLTGVEAASEIAEAWPSLRVTLLSRAPVGDGWSARAREHLLSALARLGVEVREGVRVRAVGHRTLSTDGGPEPFDACVWAAGFLPSPVARQAGLAVNEAGQALLDPFLRSISHPHVYACGDAATLAEPSGQPLPMGCKSAQPTGAHAADNLARELRGEAPRPLDYAAPFFCVSLGRRDGLVQAADGRGGYEGKVLVGRRAAWVKELVCRYVVWALHLERLGVTGVRWARTGGVRTGPGASPRPLAA